MPPAPGLALGLDELVDVGVVDAQHRHLRAPPQARHFHGGAGLLEHVDVAAGPRGERCGAAHQRAARAQGRKVIAHPTPAPQGFGRLTQRLVDAGVAGFVVPEDAVAHRLHEAVDQRGVQAGACPRQDAPGHQPPLLQRLFEAAGPLFAHGGVFGLRQGMGHAHEQVFAVAFAGLQVALLQDLAAQVLLGQGQAALEQGRFFTGVALCGAEVVCHHITSAPGRTGAGGGGGSAIMQSVVSTSAAIDAAFCSARRVTLAGSITPICSRSP